MMIHFQICKNEDEDIEMRYLTKDHIRNVTSHKAAKVSAWESIIDIFSFNWSSREV